MDVALEDLCGTLARVVIRVHPHVCGELNYYTIIGSSRYGSSPRVWGTPAKTLWVGYIDRFIPTCVGNSDRAYTDGKFPAVHPHVCGELAVSVKQGAVLAGSSPRVWGTPDHSHFYDDDLRFIPTCVGNSLKLYNGS